MALFFKLNNTDFPPLSCPNFSMSCSSVPFSLPYATWCNSLSDNVSLLLDIDYIVCHVISSDIRHQHIPLSVKFCIFFMMLFNVTSLNQSIQNVLVFDISMDLILLLLVLLQYYSSMSDRLSFNFKQHKHPLKPSLDCFLTCSIIKATCNIIINYFGLHLKVFTLLTVYILLCLTNKIFDGVA